MAVNVEDLSEEQLKKLQEALNVKLKDIVIKAETEASKLLEPYGMDIKMIVTIGSGDKSKSIKLK
jgi:murein tripeptide amidase MpaA